MPELTRLRRNLRDFTESPFVELQGLLDVTDGLYEDLEVTERDLRNYNSLTQEMIQTDVDAYASAILSLIIQEELLSVYKIFKMLTARHSMQYIEENLASLKQEIEERSKEDSKDHPF